MDDVPVQISAVSTAASREDSGCSREDGFGLDRLGSGGDGGRAGD